MGEAGEDDGRENGPDAAPEADGPGDAEPTRVVRVQIPGSGTMEISEVPLQMTVSMLRARLEQLPAFVARRGIGKIRQGGVDLDGAAVLPDGDMEFVFEEARRVRLILVTFVFFLIHAAIYPVFRRFGGSATLALYATTMCVFGTAVGPVEAAASNRVLRCVGQVIALFIRSFSPAFELEQVLLLPPL